MNKPARAFRMAFPILKNLGLNPDITAYAVAKRAKIDIPTTYKTMEMLVEAGLVKVRHAGKHTTGLLKESYSVTSQGIVALLQGAPRYVQISKQDVSNIARNHTGFLPLIFGRWSYFQEKGVEDLAYKFLLIAVENTEDEVEHLASVVRSEKPKPTPAREERVHRHDIYETMLVRSWIYESEEKEAWREVVTSRSDLVAMAENEIARMRTKTEEDLRLWESALAELHGKKTGGKHVLLAGPGAEWSQDEMDYFEAWVANEQAKAIDEGRPIPSSAKVIVDALGRDSRRAHSTKERKRAS
jgi:DNA-binding PadR family transcriptional regulator